MFGVAADLRPWHRPLCGFAPSQLVLLMPCAEGAVAYGVLDAALNAAGSGHGVPFGLKLRFGARVSPLPLPGDCYRVGVSGVRAAVWSCKGGSERHHTGKKTVMLTYLDRCRYRWAV